MDQDLRDELNRLWGDLKTLSALVASDVGSRWSADRIERWYEIQVANADSAMAPAVAANNRRALDALAGRMRTVARGRDNS